MAVWLNGSDWVEAIPHPSSSAATNSASLRIAVGHANLSLILREVFSRYTPQSNLPFELLFTPQLQE